MAQPQSPPSGSMPPMSGMPSPDVSSMMQQLQQQKMGGAGGPGAIGNQVAPGAQSGSPSGKTPRSVGTIPQEAKYMAEDVAQGLLSLLPDFMQSILGIKSTDSPEEKARKRQMLQRYNEMNADQQRVVQEKMQVAQTKQKQEEEEKLRAKQAQEQESSELPMPQGKTRGDAGMGGSAKKRATTKLQNDRKKLSSAG